MKEMVKNKEQGIATLELAFVLPVLLMLVFGIIDFGRLIQARLVVTNVTYEGGTIASRDILEGNDLLTALQSSGSPLDLKTLGRIYVSQLKAGTSAAAPDPVINSQVNAGGLVVTSGIRTAALNLGLSQELYNHLKFNANNKTADISGITVVEVFYKYTPITPLPNFIQNILVPDGGGIIVLGKSVF